MAQQQPLLRLIDPETGEITEEACPTCVNKQNTIDTLSDKITRLKGDLTKALQDADESHDAFPAFKRTWDYWRERCRHPAVKYRITHFDLFVPIFTDYGEAMCRQAIDGAAFDPYVTRRKNGRPQRHDGWELIFRRGGEKFTEFCNRAPVHLPDPTHIVRLAHALAFVHPEWDLDRAHAEAMERLKRWRR